MLLSLSIKNIVLADSLDISFGSGLTVLTGETGSGKSILLDALGLAVGKKADTKLVRHGNKHGSVTAEFDVTDSVKAILEESAIECEDTLFLRRVVYAEGKSKAFVNDNPASRTLLHKLSESLLEIHGQYEQHTLMNSSTHISVLDEYGNLNLQKIEKSYTEWRNALSAFDAVNKEAEKARTEEDYLRHVFEELDELDPQKGEKEELAEKRILMMNSDKILSTVQSAMNEITKKSDVINAINTAWRILDRNSIKSEAAMDSLDRASIEVNEAISALEEFGYGIDVNQNSLDQIEERLFALRAASRKYKTDDLNEYKEKIKEQLSLIKLCDEKILELKNNIKQREKEYSEVACKLTEKRKISAKKLEKSVMSELSGLKMPESGFVVKITDGIWSSKGCDKVTFLVRTNKGSPFSEIGEIASGGELSRFMLALRAILSKTKATIIFDEIDSGIGGSVADSVGKRLSKLGQSAQVICVTHQPQVASYGTNHLLIKKKEKNGVIVTEVTNIAGERRTEEIARMLAGELITDEARAAAAKLRACV